MKPPNIVPLPDVILRPVFFPAVYWLHLSSIGNPVISLSTWPLVQSLYLATILNALHIVASCSIRGVQKLGICNGMDGRLGSQTI